MKKILLAVVILVGLSTVANSQTNKGIWLLGGSAGYQSFAGSNIFSISPNIGYFVKNNLAIGGLFSVVGGNGSSSSTLNAYIKPYFGSSETNKWFAIGGVGTRSIYNENKFSFAMGAGNATFLNKNVALEISGTYSQISDFDEGAFDIKFGFQVHFGGK